MAPNDFTSLALSSPTAMGMPRKWPSYTSGCETPLNRYIATVTNYLIEQLNLAKCITNAIIITRKNIIKSWITRNTE